MNEAESLPPLPTRHQINQWMTDAGWQNSAIRQADLDAVERVVRQAVAAEREKAAAFADSWSKPSVVMLAAGEMSAQELRTAQAVARGIAAAIRSAK